jgi:hypothetical protein
MSKETNDSAIKQLMAKVEEQKTALGTRRRYVLNTNGIFKYDSKNGDETYFNINTISDPITFVNALSYLISQERNFNEACDRLGVKNATWKWYDFTMEEWEADFKARIEQIQYDEKKKKLDATKQKLDTLVSEEARTEMELENIQKTLGL